LTFGEPRDSRCAQFGRLFAQIPWLNYQGIIFAKQGNVATATGIFVWLRLPFA
jgi:hypothetical protein